MSGHTLAGLRSEIQRRSARIKAATHLLKLEFGPVTDPLDRPSSQYFIVTAWWQGGVYEHKFEHRACFAIGASPARWLLRPCQFTQKLVQEILRARNI